MNNKPTLTKRTFCAKLANKQAIKDSMAPLAPFPVVKTSYSEQFRQRLLTGKTNRKVN